MTQGITDRLNALGFDFENIVDVLKAVWDGFCSVLAPVFEAAFNVISTVLGTVLDVIGEGPNMQMKIQFPTKGVRQVVVKYAHLEKV